VEEAATSLTCRCIVNSEGREGEGEREERGGERNGWGKRLPSMWAGYGPDGYIKTVQQRTIIQQYGDWYVR